jgi:hypothetical protein
MSDDQVWNAFISAIPAQDKARHDLENFQARLLKNALQEIEDLKLEIIQHKAEIVQLEEVLQGYSSLLHDVTKDRDRFRDDWKAMTQEASEMAQMTDDDHYIVQIYPKARKITLVFIGDCWDYNQELVYNTFVRPLVRRYSMTGWDGTTVKPLPTGITNGHGPSASLT